MKCKNEIVGSFEVDGVYSKGETVEKKKLFCVVSNSEKGKALSVFGNGIQFLIPIEPLKKHLKQFNDKTPKSLKKCGFHSCLKTELKTLKKQKKQMVFLKSKQKQKKAKQSKKT